MELKRFFGTVAGDTACLSDEEHFHCIRVTRYKVGYKLIVCNGDGYDYLGEIVEITPNQTRIRVLEKSLNNTEPAYPLRLLFSPCKEMDFVVQKGVELGVTEFYPYISARTSTQPPKQERLEKIVEVGAKQCGRAMLPTVRPVVSLEEALRTVEADVKIFCYEECKEGGIRALFSAPASAAVLIGPEGGFTPEESEMAQSFGFNAVTLGKRILRVETAAVAALTLTLEGMGEL